MVAGVGLDLHQGEILAIVGASGSGKSTTARAVMGMVPVQSGAILLDGELLPPTSQARSASVRRRIGMVFRDSSAAFNPRFRVGRIIEEPLVLSGFAHVAERRCLVDSLLQDVGLAPALATRFPNELSGGHPAGRLARALTCAPDILICDEAVSALDVSIQAQILNLLVELQERRKVAMLFISHDPDVVAYLADRTIIAKNVTLAS